MGDSFQLWLHTFRAPAELLQQACVAFETDRVLDGIITLVNGTCGDKELVNFLEQGKIGQTPSEGQDKHKVNPKPDLGFDPKKEGTVGRSPRQ